jgi:hypothetical protein
MTKIAPLTEEGAPAHYHVETSSPTAAIILDVFGGLAPSEIGKPPDSRAGYLFGLKEQTPDEECPQSKMIFNISCLIFFGHGEDKLYHLR